MNAVERPPVLSDHPSFRDKESVVSLRRISGFAGVARRMRSERARFMGARRRIGSARVTASLTTATLTSRLGDMTADRHELHELVDALPDDQVAWVLADVRSRCRSSVRAMRGRRRSSAWEWTGTVARISRSALTSCLPEVSARPGHDPV